ncbi:mini-chromosome maintenance replisome factor-domain-containing protein [Cristinia sonorae]|uniref:Mini-chromosome maintenance replisome factor-domain-containing protein n=1 Tax=Cristinia sonorae TaxID=1940300 RepID=A0A8K0UUI6_9AGAR|nr:mini-chromosome maintenance replisome factor-domain-containing protein [Cristinia sonorae]
MVSAYLADALRDPTGELQELYTQSPFDNFPAEVAKHFSRVFERDEAFKQIPPLNLQNPPGKHDPRSLVRFRAMVQDPSSSSEMYLARTKSGKLSGWGIEVDDGDHHDVEVENLRECTVLWAISVPGESEWVSKALDVSEAAIYDTQVGQNLKATDIVTFVGILTNELMSLESEDESLVVPTLHVLFLAAPKHCSIPALYPSSTSQVRQQLIDWIAEEALGGDLNAAEWTLLLCLSKVQKRTPPLLQPSMTLSHFPLPPSASEGSPSTSSAPIMQKVLSILLPLVRTLPLSIDLLNRVAFEPESVNEDIHSGALQLPQGSVLLVTEHGVQEGKLVERGIMNVRALQDVMVSQHLAYSFPFSRFTFPTDITCIVTTEGSKSAFFKTDITVPLTITTTTNDTPNLYKPKHAIRLPSDSQLAAFRNLILGARTAKVEVTDTISTYIQQDFVSDRQRDKSITSEDLIRRMTIARLYALSCHSAELTADIWERAKALDEKRKTSLAQV